MNLWQENRTYHGSVPLEAGYRDLGDLPYVKKEVIFNRADAGFAYDSQ